MPLSPFEALAGIANACQVLPSIVTGGQPNSEQLKALKRAGGAIVLDLRDPMEPRPLNEPELVRELELEYANVPVTSGTLNDQTLERILEILRKAGDKTVFVHCGSGNRVAAALIPYFMIDEKMAEEDAVNQAMRVGLRSPEMLEWGLEYARRHST